MASTSDLAGVQFIVDDREHNEDLLYGLGEMGAEKKHLQHHDIIVGPFGVERKEAADFISSVFDGRLREQQAASSESGKRRILVVEGDIYRAMAFTRSSSFTPGLYYAALADLSAMGVTLVNTPDVKGTVAYVGALLKRSLTPLTEIEEQVVKLKRVSTYEAMLRQVPGLGAQKAQKIIDAYPSFTQLAQKATYGELVRLLKPAGAEALWIALKGEDVPRPRIYEIFETMKAATITEKFPSLESNEPANWEDVKTKFSIQAANKLWEKGLAERKGQGKLA